MENNLEQFSLDFSAFFEANRTFVLIAAGLIFVLGAALLIRKKGETKSAWTIRELSVAAMCLALAFLLSFIRLWKMPQGGTVTPASMLPIMLFAYVYGTPKGLIVGLAYGFLQCLQDLYVIHWAQLIIDYIAAFTVLGLAGVFRKHIIPGMLLAGVLRFALHVISGAVFFAHFAPQDQNAYVYSIAYNSFALVDLAICMAITALPPVNKMLKSLKSRLSAQIDPNVSA